MPAQSPDAPAKRDQSLPQAGPDACVWAATCDSGKTGISRACGSRASVWHSAVSSPTGTACRTARRRNSASSRASALAARWHAAARGGCFAKVSGCINMNCHNRLNWCWSRAIRLPDAILPGSKRIFWRRCGGAKLVEMNQICESGPKHILILCHSRRIAGRFRRRKFFYLARPAAAVSRRRARNMRWTRFARRARWRAAGWR